MNHVSTYAAAATIGNPVANIAIFGVFVAITMVVVIRASRSNATAAHRSLRLGGLGA